MFLRNNSYSHLFYVKFGPCGGQGESSFPGRNFVVPPVLQESFGWDRISVVSPCAAPFRIEPCGSGGILGGVEERKKTANGPIAFPTAEKPDACPPFAGAKTTGATP